MSEDGMTRRQALRGIALLTAGLATGVGLGKFISQKESEGKKIPLTDLIDRLYKSPGKDSTYYHSQILKIFEWVDEGKVADAPDGPQVRSVFMTYSSDNRVNVDINFTDRGAVVNYTDSSDGNTGKEITIKELINDLKKKNKGSELDEVIFNVWYPQYEIERSKLSPQLIQRLSLDKYICMKEKIISFNFREMVITVGSDDKVSHLEHSTVASLSLYNPEANIVDGKRELEQVELINRRTSLVRDDATGSFYKIDDQATLEGDGISGPISITDEDFRQIDSIK